jgi:hypothetical protein
LGHWPTPTTAEDYGVAGTWEGFLARQARYKTKGVNLQKKLDIAVQDPTNLETTNGLQDQADPKSGGNTPESSWPSPRVSDSEGAVVKNVEVHKGHFSRKNKDGQRWGVKLKDAVNHLAQEEMWPTPRVSAGNGPSQKEIAQGNPKRRLETEVCLWPTPTTQEVEHPEAEICPKTGRRLTKDKTDTHSLGLADRAIRQWPTPRANKMGGSTNPTYGDCLIETVVGKKGWTPYHLSPLWVAQLMGLEADWGYPPPSWDTTKVKS